MGILLIFAFVSGLITIFAPCIWPLLPIILSSSATGEKRKPLGITLGIIISFGILTLTLSYIIKVIPFDPNLLRYFAVFVIGFLGLTLVIPKLSGRLEAVVSRLSGKFNVARADSQKQNTGFWSGFTVGIALGVVWTPCAGPILATIATLAATSSVNLGIIFVTMAYVIGVGIPLFVFATLGKYVFSKTRLFSKYTGRVQQVFGIIMIVTAILIATNYDKVLQAKLLDAFPSYSNFIYELEGNSGVQEQLDQLKNNDGQGVLQKSSGNSNSSLENLGQAPNFVGITKWLNTDGSIDISDLKGKVVLVDFWTYTCINCIRTLPHVTAWYDKYKDDGFVVIGVHTPEFEFEKKTENVFGAIDQYKIHYPVAQDNDYATWRNYNNKYWPAKYLIDANGNVRYVHFGEGKYDETEENIQMLLKEAGTGVNKTLSNISDQTPTDKLSPETYLGSLRSEFYFPTRTLDNGISDFVLSNNIPRNSFSFGGKWNVTDEYSASDGSSSLGYSFYADKVFLVMRPEQKDASIQVKVFLDGKQLDAKDSGSDVKNGVVTVDSDRLYNLVDLADGASDHTLILEFGDNKVEVFAFTFG